MNDGMQGFWRAGHERCFRALRVRSLHVALAILLSVASFGQPLVGAIARDPTLDEILTYIHGGWDSLTRSTNSCTAVSDTKLSTSPVLYLPASFDQPRELEQLQRNCAVTIAHLPHVIHQLGSTDVESLQPPGFLYLKNNYVVPGGRLK